MKTIDGKELEELLKEMYRFYFKIAKNEIEKHANLTELEKYYATRAIGAEEAIGAVYLALYGGSKMNKLYSECAFGNDDNDKRTGC